MPPLDINHFTVVRGGGVEGGRSSFFPLKAKKVNARHTCLFLPKEVT
jgi:hypothetical protein